jgi:predicted CoA-binding protein
MKKTVVLGASENTDRYSNKAVKALVKAGIDTIAVGLREGTIDHVAIRTNAKDLENVDTVSLYVGPQNQERWIDSILELHPKRVIFNPGTENDKTETTLVRHGIRCEHACTLVLLATNQY